VNIDNGIGQGNPLSMILYLFYNADLLDIVKGKGQAVVAVVDDANLYAEGKTFEEAYRSILHMLKKPKGGLEWTHTHNSRFKNSKFAMLGFSKKHVPDPQQAGKTKLEPHPDFIFQGMRVKLVTLHKSLGVIFDQELCWKEQAENATPKATKWTLLFCRLTKPSTGIKH